MLREYKEQDRRRAHGAPAGDRHAHRRRLPRPDDEGDRRAARRATRSTAREFTVVKNSLTRRAAEAAGADAVLDAARRAHGHRLPRDGRRSRGGREGARRLRPHDEGAHGARRPARGQGDDRRRGRGAREAAAPRHASRPGARRHRARRCTRSSGCSPRRCRISTASCRPGSTSSAARKSRRSGAEEPPRGEREQEEEAARPGGERRRSRMRSSEETTEAAEEPAEAESEE